MTQNDPIKHIIVLAFENRSFDHVLGGLQGAIVGLDGADAARVCKDHEGTAYPQKTGASYSLRYDPKHELEHVMHQLDGGNTGFVEDFSRAYPLSQTSDRQEIMHCFAEDTLPAFHALAKSFTVCNRWFSSVPGPTWANRFFLHSGTSLGRVAMPEGILDANLHWYDQTTLYDRLNEKSIDWRIYYGDIPQSLMLAHQLESANAARYAKMQRFYLDAAGDESAFPPYSFIEPSYYQPSANDGHPPHDLREADQLLADIYHALRRNPPLWETSLLVVLFDEHGGFYDHVPPPATVAPDHHLQEYDFRRLGVRVPAILVSPYMAQCVIDTVFDHTSLLRYASDKWNLGPLGERVKQANSLASALIRVARDDTPETLPALAPGETGNAYGQLAGRSQGSLQGYQASLVAMTQLLESMTRVADNTLMARVKRLVTGLDGVTDVAIERVEDFLDERKK